MLLLSDKLMRCCAGGTNGCLAFRRRAFAVDEQVSAKWSRCPESMAWRARDSVAPMRRSSAGWMPARIGRLFIGVGRSHPVTICKALLKAGRWGGYEYCSTKQARSTLRLSAPGLGWLFTEFLLQHPSRSQQGDSGEQRMWSAFCEVTQGVGDTWATCPKLLRGI